MLGKKGDVMNYKEEAKVFLEIMHENGKVRSQKKFNDQFGGGRFILQLLSENKRMTPSEIKDKMHVSSARVATALNLLEEKTFITRKNDKSDRRKIIVELTKQGMIETEKITDRITDKISMLFEKIGYEDTKELIRIMNKITKIQLNKLENEEKTDD